MFHVQIEVTEVNFSPMHFDSYIAVHVKIICLRQEKKV